MKIVDVCAFYSPHGGGVKTYVERKLRIGADHGHEIVVIAPGDADRVEHRPEGGRVIFVRSPRLPFDRRYRYFEAAAAVHAALDAEDPDMVEASSPWRTASIVAEWGGSAPRALVMHADPLAAYAYRWFGGIADRETIDRQFQWFWRHMRKSAEGFDMVVCANRSLAGRLRDGGVRGAITIPMGVDPDVFSPSLRDEGLRLDLLARCGLAPDAALLLAIGRHSPEKRWPMVVDACLRAGHTTPLGLVLIGAGRDEARIHRHIGGNPHVQLLAPIADRRLLATVMASADALIHGCEAETFGLVAAEAAASGLPLIVPSEGGPADVAAPECTALYTSGDAGAAAAAILALLARDRGALRRVAAQAAKGARTMDAHFVDLFAAYGRIREPDRKVG